MSIRVPPLPLPPPRSTEVPHCSSPVACPRRPTSFSPPPCAVSRLRAASSSPERRLSRPIGWPAASYLRAVKPYAGSAGSTHASSSTLRKRTSVNALSSQVTNFGPSAPPRPVTRALKPPNPRAAASTMRPSPSTTSAAASTTSSNTSGGPPQSARTCSKSPFSLCAHLPKSFSAAAAPTSPSASRAQSCVCPHSPRQHLRPPSTGEYSSSLSEQAEHDGPVRERRQAEQDAAQARARHRDQDPA